MAGLSSSDGKIIDVTIFKIMAGRNNVFTCNVVIIFVSLYILLFTDECKSGSQCKKQQFCLNLEGSFRCMNCDQACKKCHAEGPENCIECAEGKWTN